MGHSLLKRESELSKQEILYLAGAYGPRYFQGELAGPLSRDHRMHSTFELK